VPVETIEQFTGEVVSKRKQTNKDIVVKLFYTVVILQTFCPQDQIRNYRDIQK
jgi:hypothetical protein